MIKINNVKKQSTKSNPELYFYKQGEEVKGLTSYPTGVRQYKEMIKEIHKEIGLLESNLFPVRDQVPREGKDAKAYGVELLGELNGIIYRLRKLNEEVKF